MRTQIIGDGKFESADLVAALQDDGYEKGPRAVMALIPEPASVALLMAGMIGMALLGRRARACD